MIYLDQAGKYKLRVEAFQQGKTPSGKPFNGFYILAQVVSDCEQKFKRLTLYFPDPQPRHGRSRWILEKNQIAVLKALDMSSPDESQFKPQTEVHAELWATQNGKFTNFTIINQRIFSVDSDSEKARQLRFEVDETMAANTD